jgi:site-specific recombinase XerC
LSSRKDTSSICIAGADVPTPYELNYTSISFFLEFLKIEGVTHLEGVSRKHIEAFVEREQDRGLKPVSFRGRLASVKAFLQHLIEEGEFAMRFCQRRSQ